MEKAAAVAVTPAAVLRTADVDNLSVLGPPPVV